MSDPEFDVAILGGGFAGVGLASRLKTAGYNSFVILEKAGAVGGTWRDNTYPGCSCDVPSHLYSFSFESNPDWSSVYSPQPEILGYIEGIVARCGLERHLRLGCEVIDSRWDAEANMWHVRTSQGVLTARVFVAAWGQLNRPFLPTIPGYEEFVGTSFHSARWPAGLDLDSKRVASIGTGASAAQYIPELAQWAAHLTVFQRSAPWVVPRNNRLYTAEERDTYRRSPTLMTELRDAIYHEREARTGRIKLGSDILDEMEMVSRNHLCTQVQDSELRRKLTPDYPAGCKRMIISDDYYPALARPNVEVVTSPLARIVPYGVITSDGTEHRADILVFGTGFETHSFQGAVEVHGRDGRSLRDVWSGTPSAYLGMAVSGFPNFAMLYGPNTNLGHNSVLEMLEAQFDLVLRLLPQVVDGSAFDIRPDVMQRFNKELQATLAGSVWAAGCDSWYKNAEGVLINNWSGGVNEYRAAIRAVDDAEFEWLPQPQHGRVHADAADA